METGKTGDLGGRLALTAAFSEVPDPHVEGRSKYDLVEMLVISVGAMVCGIEDFVGIESWSKERIDWLRRFLMLENSALLNSEWVPMSLTRAPALADGENSPPLTPPQGGEVLSAGRARGQAPHGFACPKPLSVPVAGGASRVRFAGLRPPLIRHQPLTLCA